MTWRPLPSAATIVPCPSRSRGSTCAAAWSRSALRSTRSCSATTFPCPVKRLVGEAAVLASLLATSLKDVGRFILQTQTDGPVSHGRGGRAHARADPRDGDLRRGGGGGGDGRTAASTAALLGRGTLAMTVEQGQTQQRYQGYVPLEAETLEAAAHTYFRQSEQIPTRIRLAVAEMYDRDAEGGCAAAPGGRAASSASSCRWLGGARPASRPAGRRRAGGARSARPSRRTTTPGWRRRR